MKCVNKHSGCNDDSTSVKKFIQFFPIFLTLPTVSQSMRNIKDIKNTLSSIETISKRNDEKFNKWNQTMSVMMQELKNKIAKARHIADGVCSLFKFFYFVILVCEHTFYVPHILFSFFF